MVTSLIRLPCYYGLFCCPNKTHTVLEKNTYVSLLNCVNCNNNNHNNNNNNNNNSNSNSNSNNNNKWTILIQDNSSVQCCY